jgi:hypothetical protein
MRKQFVYIVTHYNIINLYCAVYYIILYNVYYIKI